MRVKAIERCMKSIMYFSLEVKHSPTLFPILRLSREKVSLQGRKVNKQHNQVNQVSKPGSSELTKAEGRG